MGRMHTCRWADKIKNLTRIHSFVPPPLTQAEGQGPGSAVTNVNSTTRGNVGVMGPATTGRAQADLPGTHDHNANLDSAAMAAPGQSKRRGTMNRVCGVFLIWKAGVTARTPRAPT